MYKRQAQGKIIQEQEAAAAAAAAAAARANSSSSSPSYDGGGAGKGGSIASDYAAGGGKNPGASTGVSGSSVVSYAMPFVGNPYVWGGNSLTNGVDLSLIHIYTVLSLLLLCGRCENMCSDFVDTNLLRI